MTHYIDDQEHLRIIFECLMKAGQTLRGRKCHISRSTVSYLGHIFSDTRMTPSPKKILDVQEWPRPTNVNAVCQFLGLDSYYRRYICQLLTSKSTAQSHQEKCYLLLAIECENAFTTLKVKFKTSPVLVYPQFNYSTSEFVLQTDASDVRLDAVLK